MPLHPLVTILLRLFAIVLLVRTFDYLVPETLVAFEQISSLPEGMEDEARSWTEAHLVILAIKVIVPVAVFLLAPLLARIVVSKEHREISTSIHAGTLIVCLGIFVAMWASMGVSKLVIEQIKHSEIQQTPFSLDRYALAEIFSYCVLAGAAVLIMIKSRKIAEWSCRPPNIS